ncbi:hypothetical protein [Pseudonocardia sp. GCM10023141]
MNSVAIYDTQPPEHFAPLVHDLMARPLRSIHLADPESPGAPSTTTP